MNVQTLQRGERIEMIEPVRGDPLRSIARAAIAHARAALGRYKILPDDIAARAWPFDHDVHLVLRASTTPTGTTDAAALVQILLAVLPGLASQSAAADLFDASLKLQWTGHGTFAIPGIVPPSAKFVGEGLPKPVLQGVSSAPTMGPSKMAAITVASAELIAQTAPEQMIMTMLAESVGPALDAVVFGSAAASGTSPAGLLNGLSATPETPAGAAVYDAILADLGTLAGKVSSVGGNGRIAFVMNPQQAITASLAVNEGDRYLILGSNAVPVGTVIAVATNALASVLGMPEFETSTQTMLQMDDSPSGSVMSGGSTSSMFQTNNVAIKMLLPVTWARRAAAGVAFMSSVSW